MTEMILKIAQKGFAAGEAFLLKDMQRAGEEKAVNTEDEISRLKAAASVLEQEFSDAASNREKEEAAIFQTESMLLEDKSIIDKVCTLIRGQGLSASAAVSKTGEELAVQLEQSGSEYNRQRSEDIRGLMKRIIGILNDESEKKMTGPSILVAEELSPAALAAPDKQKLRGIITLKGSSTSHVSVLAGSLGIPYIFGSSEAISEIQDGDRLIIDGEHLQISPDEETYQKALLKAAELKKEKSISAGNENTGKCRTKICANIAGPQEIDSLITSGADGVGLYRSEFLFINHTSEPTEEEQFRAYKAVAEAMGEKEVIIRTMDLGSDKTPKWLSLPAERNPALGLRGVRISLREEKLFRVQLYALLRAAVCGNIKIMLPMISSVWEVEAVKELIDSCAEELKEAGIPYEIPALGVMIETPAAVMIAEELAEKTDFFSIGTNDLTQYTIAVDRESEGLDRYCDLLHESVFRLIAHTAAAAHKKNIPVGVCGELAGNEKAIKRLIEAGIDELSVSVSKIAEVRKLAFGAEQECLKADTSRKAISSIAAPADGELIPMEDIPDPAFSSGKLGPCLGIMPENGSVYSPCDGIISLIAETKHAVTITASDGRNILVHAGIDTVRLAGKGMDVLAGEGDFVLQGQKIMEINIDQIREAGFSPMVIVADLV